MTNMAAWLAAVVTVATLVCYEVVLAFGHRRKPGRLARTAHAALREEWFDAVSAQKGSEILAVQTLRTCSSALTAFRTTKDALLLDSPARHQAAPCGVYRRQGLAAVAQLVQKLVRAASGSNCVGIMWVLFKYDRVREPSGGLSYFDDAAAEKENSPWQKPIGSAHIVPSRMPTN